MQVADDFLGEWRIKRVITDRLSGQVGHLEGTVRFSQEDARRLLYTEQGMLRFGSGAAMAATRRYIWHFADADVAVFFEDGASFHRFVPDGAVAGTDHPCGDDVYTVRYDFTAWPRWQAVWTVAGPRKDYTSQTVFYR